ncbi:hypothetical protein CORC01_01885 [Colletotrichum orchidophilum]|uniref:Uncharacterized protein n=1 Tax=Colletotrichum orchidophilum TaxID=1209926 RepID=A0A1G4BMZ9_9PEZI|nr:uncharacterized protein CORC01_01885 [Colletotrichum orchidophilum]OHF02784.1 hypothetical protein CORC01_01885 [Colletotrichum orchidophilum]
MSPLIGYIDSCGPHRRLFDLLGLLGLLGLGRGSSSRLNLVISTAPLNRSQRPRRKPDSELSLFPGTCECRRLTPSPRFPPTNSRLRRGGLGCQSGTTPIPYQLTTRPQYRL